MCVCIGRGRGNTLTGDASRCDLLVVALDDRPQFLVLHDAHVVRAIAVVLRHHVRHVQPA